MSEASNGDRIGRIEGKVTRIEDVMRMLAVRLEEMDKKLDDLLYEDDAAAIPTQTERMREEMPFGANVTQVSDFITEETIRQQGQKIPYNKLMGAQIKVFKEFLGYIRLNESKFTPKEYEFAGYADKNFSDIRISDNSRRILGTAYQKLYKKPWNFTFIRGYMYKFEGQMAWEWSDGSND